MAPLAPSRHMTPPRSGLPHILFRTVLLVAAAVGMDAVTGGGIRRGVSDGSDVSIGRATERAVISIRGTIDGHIRKPFTL